MTDFSGSEEPTRKDPQDVDAQAPIIPIGSGAAGAVEVPVTVLLGEHVRGSDGEPLVPADDKDKAPDDDEDDEPPDGVQHQGGIGEVIRGLLGRDKFR